MKEKNPWCTLSKILVLNYKPGTRFPIEENIWDTGFWKSIVHLKKKKNSMVFRDALRVFRLNQESIPENFDDAKRGLLIRVLSV